MKFFHLADLHIGKRVNEFSMIEDQKFILNQITELAVEHKPDCILIAGDVYDKSVPPAEAVGLLDSFFSQLCRMGIKIFAISGNHDSPERLSFCASVMESAGVHISPVFSGEVSKTTLKDEHGNVNIYMLPFVKPVNVRAVYGIDGQMSYTEAVDYVLSSVTVDETERNILLAHQFVTGAERSDSEEISVGGLDNVDVSVFDRFDYAALGHIHRSQKLVRDTVRYSGTPLKYSFSEANHTKSITVVDIGEKGSIDISFLGLKPLHDMVEIRGEFNMLISEEFCNRLNTDDYMHITLTDENDIVDAMGKLRCVYPNIMKLDYDNTRTRESREIFADESAVFRNPIELFSDLYELQNNSPMTDEQKDYVQKIIEDIWG